MVKKILTPFVDAYGIIRVGGRVDNAVVSCETKHPVLLPYNHRISRLKADFQLRVFHTYVYARKL